MQPNLGIYFASGRHFQILFLEYFLTEWFVTAPHFFSYPESTPQKIWHCWSATGVLNPSKVLYKTFSIAHRIYLFEIQCEIKTFHNILIHFKIIFHIKKIRNTKSIFIKLQKQEYLGHVPCTMEIQYYLVYYNTSIREIKDIYSLE